MIQNLSPKETEEHLHNHTALLFDVRESEEFTDRHIPHACSLPLSNFKESLAKIVLKPDQAVILHCLSGKRSAMACEILKEHGHNPDRIYNMQGGIMAWEEANLPTIAKQAGISIFRQVQMIIGFLIALLTIAGFIGMTAAFALAGILGAALCFAGVTGWCGLALLLKKMPWNR